jgi:DNA-binding HxlR family transcriptional regulator
MMGLESMSAKSDSNDIISASLLEAVLVCLLPTIMGHWFVFILFIVDPENRNTGFWIKFIYLDGEKLHVIMAEIRGEVVDTGNADPIDSDLAFKLIEDSANKLRGSTPIDMGKALKKASKLRSLKIYIALKDHGPSSYRYLSDKTGLSDSELGHALAELKQDNLLIMKGDEYSPTKFGDTLLGSVKKIFDSLRVAEEDEIFETLDSR